MHSTSGVNKAFLIGHIENLPKKHFKPNGRENLHLTITTTETIRKAAQEHEHKEYHNLIIDVNHPDIKGKEIKKGQLVFVTGKIQTKMIVDGDGIKRYKTEIAVLQMEFL